MSFSAYAEDSNQVLLSQQSLSQMVGRDPEEYRGKIVHDNVHEHILIPPALMLVVDTPQFQRLRDLHQLGNTRYLYPGASHSRFEHSLGVAHLASEFLSKLKHAHELHGPSLNLTPQDEICVAMAGLVHDLGHGPMSHMFEDFVNDTQKRKGLSARFHHEDASQMLFRRLIELNQLDFSPWGITPDDLTFVEQLINGLRPDAPWPAGNGRPEEKRFLFDIVANKRNGIDVDKLDYFLRDSMHCYGKLPAQLHVDRLFACARVINVQGRTQVCFEEKVALSLMDLFTLRAKLHKFVYQHRVVKVLDRMTLDALAAAEGHFTIEVSGNRKVSLADTAFDMEAYEKTGDWIFNAILATTSPELAESRRILNSIRCRQLYTLVGMYADVPNKPAKDVIAESRAYLPPHINEVLPQDAIVPLMSCIVFGSSGDKIGDPLNNVFFYNPKRNVNMAFRLNQQRISPLFAPTEYVEKTVFVVCRVPMWSEAVKEAFHVYRSGLRKKLREPVAFANVSPTPKKRGREVDVLSSPTQPSDLAPEPAPAVAALDDEVEEERTVIPFPALHSQT